MQKNNLSFSIVIPSYNSSKYIGNALESCLQQTLLPKEIIVIDDCSIDNTCKIVEQFNSPLISLFVNSTNMGPSYCRNMGIKNTTSSWILFLDADDIFHKRKIEILNRILIDDLTITAIGHSSHVGLTLHNLNEQIIQQDFNYSKLSTISLLLKNRIVTPAFAVSVNNGILFNENMKYAEDHDFIIKNAAKGKLVYLNLKLCSINRLPLSVGGLSSDFMKMRKGEINMYIDFCSRNNKIYLIPFFLIFSFLKHFKFLIYLRFSRIYK